MLRLVKHVGNYIHIWYDRKVTMASLVLIILYSLLLLSLTFLGIKKKLSFSFKTVLILGIILRILISLSFISLVHYDTLSYKLIGTLTLQGKTIYPADAYYHYPYFPGFIYIEALSIFFAKLGFPYMLFLKLFFSAFDVGIIYLLYLLSKKNIKVAFLYAVNPAMILLSSAHGQIEALPIFFSLLAFYLYREKKELLTSLALGFAILTKVWPLFFLPFFLKYTKKWHVYALALLIPVVSVLIYAFLFNTPVLSVLHPPFSYRGGYGAWGISTVTQFFLPADKGSNNAIIKSVANITIILLLTLFFLRKKTNILNEASVFMLLFGTLVLSGANPVWLVPFILLMQPPKWEYWFFIVNIYMSISITAEVFHMLNKSSHIFFTTTVFTAMLLWIINLVIVFDFLRVRKLFKKG